MSGFVINYDHKERDPNTGKALIVHYVLRPCGGHEQAELTRKNLELNPNVINLTLARD